MQMISRASGNNWEDEDRIWSISRLLLRIVGTGIPLLRCFITKQKSSGVYRIGIYPYVRAHTYTCVLQYKLLTTQSRGENISKKLQSDRSKLHPGRPREYWESNCFFIRSNILIDSIRLPMNYSLKEEWPFLRRVYCWSVYMAPEIKPERSTIDHHRSIVSLVSIPEIDSPYRFVIPKPREARRRRTLIVINSPPRCIDIESFP